jgi:hypothetical protein
MRWNTMLRPWIVAVTFAALCQTGHASEVSTFRVSVNTASLTGNSAGPFSIAFALTDGNGLSDASSIVKVTDVNFGNGTGAGTSVLFGGASGTLETGVTMTTSSFLSLFVQTFSPGSHLHFTLSLTTANRGRPDLFGDDESERHRQVAFGIPDRLTFFILDGAGMPIATLAPVADFLLGVNLTSDPSAEVFGSDASRPPFTGNALSIRPPKVERDGGRGEHEHGRHEDDRERL